MIEYLKDSGLISITTKNSSYIFTADANLKSLHWGGLVNPADCVYLAQPLFNGPMDPDLTLEATEYPIADGQYFTLPCLRSRIGNRRISHFQLNGYAIAPPEGERQRLELTLNQPDSGLILSLIYNVFEDYDMIERRAVLKNSGRDPVSVRRMMTGALHLPRKETYSLRYLSGTWTAENQITDMPVTTGTFTMDSRLGSTSHRFNPSFALSQDADEVRGEVWFGLLGCTGSWKIEIDQTIFGTVSVLAGRNDFEGELQLMPGETLCAPPLVFGYTQDGFGGMSRKLHRVQRDHFSVTQRLRRVLYNSWEATAFDVTTENQIALAQKAASMGVELFVVDDGWFGKRYDDFAGLGDWTVNHDKFPGGLHFLIQEVNSLGMDFGLWVEPESVNPDSDLYRAHPDWIYRQVGLEPRQIRNQYLLNLSLPQVRSYLKEVLSRLLETYRITFFKWDMNRYLTDLDCTADQSAAHEQALYEIWDYLHEQFPNVELENCASGGGRCDLGMLSRAHQCWTSDNTDPFERLFIQEGFTQFYCPNQMMCWVTDMAGRLGRTGRNRISYLFHSAMCGGLGIGTNITKLNNQDFQLYRQYISLYKQIRETVQSGNLYRLKSPRTEKLSSAEYVSQDGHEVLVFAFLHSQTMEGMIRNDPARSPDEKHIRLQGLDLSAVYTFDDGRRISGSTLMHLGLPINLRNDFDSCLIRLTRV